jgi:release factor glutamine methyltransferase
VVASPLPAGATMDLRRKLWRRLLARSYGAFVSHATARPSEARFLGHRLLTDPQVFHPVYFLSTRVLADSLRRFDLQGKRFLDMGTGSGALGIVAGAAGARVTACDINPRAVALACENFGRNGIDGDVLESDVFSALGGRTFDIICFNVPFYEGEPGSPQEAAFYAGSQLSTIRRFAAGCAAALDRHGEALVIFSEDSGRDRILSMFAQAGLGVVCEQFTRRFVDNFHVVRFKRAP